MKTLVVDFDDFGENERSLRDLQRLEAIKRSIPEFKATLFTIPAHCSVSFLSEMKEQYPWLDLVQHGWHHQTNYECLKWDTRLCRQALRDARGLGFTTRGFKAPGWQISDACYEVLLEEDYWVADQTYNSNRRPPHLPSYLLFAGTGLLVRREARRPSSATAGETLVDNEAKPLSVMAIHGHIGHLGGYNANALELMMPYLIAFAKGRDFEFKFISEVL